MGALFGGAALAKRPDTLAAMLENTRVTGGLLGTNPAPAMAGMLDGGGSPAMQQQAMPAVHQPRPTFGSTGQPFDYEAARNALVTPERKSSTLQTIAQIAEALQAIKPAEAATATG